MIRLFMTQRGSFSWIFFFFSFRFRGVSALSTRSQIFPLNMSQRWPDWEGTKGFGEGSTAAVPSSECDESPSLSAIKASAQHGEAPSLYDSSPSGYKLDWDQWRQSACWCMNSRARQSPNMLLVTEQTLLKSKEQHICSTYSLRSLWSLWSKGI